jgi:predicted DNA-binding ribbon-helix-helix protein
MKTKPKSKLLNNGIPNGHTRLVLNVETKLHRKLKVIAAKRGITMGRLVESLIASLP